MSASSAIGELFRSLREKNSMSQPDIERAGGPKQSLQSRIERGEIKSVTDETTRSYAAALKMSVEQLRERIEAAEGGQITDPLKLGFIHGISAAPIIAMLMDGQLGNITAASMRDDQGEWQWIKSGERPKWVEDKTTRNQLTGLQAHTLQKQLSDLDMIVAPSDRLKGFWKDGGTLIRYAQISSQPAFDFMVFGPKGSGTDDSKKSDDKSSLSDHRGSKIYYLPDTLGENYAAELAGDTFKQEDFFPYTHQEIDQLDEESEPFRAIIPYPMSSTLEDKYKGPQGRSVVRVPIHDVFEHATKLAPRYSIDILLRRDSPSVVEWLNGDGYDRFSELLKAYEDQLADKLTAMQTIVRNVADYLGEENPENALKQLRRCPFKLMHYPEFTRFVLNVRTRRVP
jgi:transcriptional regulator with XRE-family HTH domain